MIEKEDCNCEHKSTYREIIKKGMNYSDEDLEEACVTITTTDYVYPFAFIDFETDEYLGVNYTTEDFTEKFIVLNKKYIISVAIVYQNDIVLEDISDIDDDASYV